jgi:negative regulator of flagellin synthesis FlgM
MTIINSILPGVARNNEASQKNNVSPQNNSVNPNKIHDETLNEITRTEEDVLIDFSSQSKEAFSILDFIDEIPDIREQKVASLRQQIEDGTYSFDYELTAANMVEEFLNAKI